MCLKVILGIIAGVVIVLVVGVFIAISNYDYNELKPGVSRAIEDATGRKLTLAGDLDFKLGLNPSLVVENVSFQNAPWGARPELATIRRIEIQVSLLPLIHKVISVKRVVLIEPDILVETDESGRSNLSFGTAAQAAEAQQPQAGGEAGEASGGSIPVLDFNEVRIERGLLTYRDARSGKSGVVKLDKLTLSASGPDSPIELECEGAYDENAFEASGTFGSLSSRTHPGNAWPVSLLITVAGATIKIDGETKDGAGGASTFAFNVDAQGPSMLELARLARVKDMPDMGPFKAVARIVGQKDRVGIEKLDSDLGREDLVRLKLSGAIEDLLTQRGIDVAFEAAGKDVAALEQLTGKGMALRGPFQASGRVTDSGEKIYKVADLKARLAESDVGGTLEMDLSRSRPKVTGALTSQNLDLRPMMPRESGADAKAEPGTGRVEARPDRVFSTQPLPLDLLKKVDANLQIRADRIMTHKLVLDRLVTSIAIEDGALSLKPLDAGIGNGSVKSQMTVKPLKAGAGGASMELILRVKSLDLGRLTRNLGITRKLEGIVDLDVDARGAGSSVAELMANLDGKTLLVMGEGQIENKYLDLIGGDLGSNILRMINPFSRDSEYTRINCLVSGFEIRNGLAQSSALVFDTDRMSVVGEGNIDLKTEKLGISFQPSPKEGIGASRIANLGVSLGEFAKPFKLAGTLAKPSLSIDASRAALTVGKAVGGVALFGPAGIAALLESGSSGGEGNRCVAAIEAAKKGVRVKEKGMVEKSTDGIKDVTKGAEERIKKLFGR